MKNLEEVMNAFARVLDKPRNPLYAMQDFFEKLEEHGEKALQEWKTVAKLLPLGDHMNLVGTVDAFAGYLRTPEGHVSELLRLLDTLNRNGQQALREYDEVTDIINGLEDAQTVTEEAKEVKVA